jgi:hypothetical protein
MIVVLIYFCANVPVLAQETIVRVPIHLADENGNPVTRTFVIIDSKWGFIPKINLALAKAVSRCIASEPSQSEEAGLPELLALAPQRFGDNSIRAVAVARSCGVLPAASADRLIFSDSDWKALLPNDPIPTVAQRSWAISLRGAGRSSDYDGVAFEVSGGPGDVERQYNMQWGPGRATLDDGCYVQRILRDYGANELGQHQIKVAFAENQSLLELLDAPCGTQTDALKTALADDTLREGISVALSTLARDPALRAAYDRAYLGVEGAWTARIGDYYKLYARAGLRPTQVDYAFFIELARSSRRLTENEISNRATRLKVLNPIDPASGRRALLSFMASPGEFLRGRAVAYWIDGVGEVNLTPDEKKDWIAHSRTRASDLGLTEEGFFPCHLLPRLRECKTSWRKEK